MKDPGFQSVHDRPAVKGRGIVSEAQRQFLTQKDPALAKNMERFSPKTEVRPFRKRRK